MTAQARWAVGLTLAALLWAFALVAYLLLWPAYSSGQTIIEENGSGVLPVLLAPGVLTLVAAVGLHARCKRGSRLGSGVANVAASVLGVLGFLGAATIGLFVLPLAALLGGAIAHTPKP
jgi:hypothetical protein